MRKKLIPKITPMLLVASFATTVAAGCGPKDVDPDAKIDAPGYYNGPMKGKGSKGGEPPAPSK